MLTPCCHAPPLAGNPAQVESPEAIQELALFLHRNKSARGASTPPGTSPAKALVRLRERSEGRAGTGQQAASCASSCHGRARLLAPTRRVLCAAPPTSLQIRIQEVACDTPAGRTRLSLQDAELEHRWALSRVGA